MSTDTEQQWTKYATGILVGRTIKSVSYMTNNNADECEWFKRPLMIVLDDDTLLCPMKDDEGNDGGAITWETMDGNGVFPVLPVNQ